MSLRFRSMGSGASPQNKAIESVSAEAGSKSRRYRIHIIVRQVRMERQTEIMAGQLLGHGQARPPLRTDAIHSRKQRMMVEWRKIPAARLYSRRGKGGCCIRGIYRQVD